MNFIGESRAIGNTRALSNSSHLRVVQEKSKSGSKLSKMEFPGSS